MFLFYSALKLARGLLKAGFLHHILHAHDFKDKFLFYAFNPDMKKWWTIDLEVTVAKMCSDARLINANSSSSSSGSSSASGVVSGRQLLQWCAQNMTEEVGTSGNSGKTNEWQNPTSAAGNLIKRLIRAHYLVDMNEASGEIDGNDGKGGTPFEGTDASRYGFTLLAQQVHAAATNRSVVAAVVEHGVGQGGAGMGGAVGLSPEEISLKIEQMKQMEQQLRNIQQQQQKQKQDLHL